MQLSTAEQSAPILDSAAESAGSIHRLDSRGGKDVIVEYDIGVDVVNSEPNVDLLKLLHKPFFPHRCIIDSGVFLYPTMCQYGKIYSFPIKRKFVDCIYIANLCF